MCFSFFLFNISPTPTKGIFFSKIVDSCKIIFSITIIVFWYILNKFSLMVIVGFKKINAATVTCTTVYGTEKGDTCSAVAEKFKLPADAFLAINPNINCVKIFVGQWLCIDGSVSPWIGHLPAKAFIHACQFNQWKVKVGCMNWINKREWMRLHSFILLM